MQSTHVARQKYTPETRFESYRSLTWKSSRHVQIISLLKASDHTALGCVVAAEGRSSMRVKEGPVVSVYCLAGFGPQSNKL